MKYFSLLIGVLFLFSNLCSQTAATSKSLFSIIDINNIQLTPSETAKVQSAITKYGVNNVHAIKVLDLSTVQDNGSLDLPVPGISTNCVPTFTVSDIQYTNDNEYTWFGHVGEVVASSSSTGTNNFPVSELACFEGYTTLQSTNGELLGTINLTSDSYEIYRFRSDTSILIQTLSYSSLDTNYTYQKCLGLPDLDSLDNANGSTSRPTNSDHNTSNSRSTSECPITILALYTPGAEAEAFNVIDYINSSFNTSNLILQNSFVSSSLVEYDLVSIQLLNSNIFTPTPANRATSDLIDLSTNTLVDQLRTNAGADIVVVFTESIYSQITGEVLASLDQTRAYSICEVGAAMFTNNVPHELAHFFDCRHTQCSRCQGFPWCDNFSCNDASSNVTDATAYYFRISNSFPWPWKRVRYTTLNNGPGDATRMTPYYSNPIVSYRGTQVGASDANNAAQITLTSCDIANFVTPANLNLQVSIQGPNSICECTAYSLSANVIDAVPGPLQFTWERSFDGGITFNSTGSTTSIISLYSSCGTDIPDVVRVTVTDDDGNTATSTATINLDSPQTCQGSGGQNLTDSRDTNTTVGSISFDSNESNTLVIYPNPSSSSIKLKLAHDQELDVVTIIDSRGVTIKTLTSNLTDNTIDISHLNSGHYFLRAKTKGGDLLYNRFLVLK